jgi:GNAT superfamily N-acetyltransferase
MPAPARSSFRPPPVQGALDDLFAAAPRLRLSRGERDAYLALRLREPQLVSLADGRPAAAAALEALVLREGDAVLGAVSYGVQANPNRPPGHARYARIDIVVVPPEARGLGCGRLLLACVTAHLLRSQGGQLYSLSCLAAHPAIAHVLESAGFLPGPRTALHYVHEELRVELEGRAALAARWDGEVAAALRRVAFALRQRSVGRKPVPR